MKKDKIKIIDEQMNDDGIKRFLTYLPSDDTPEDFHILLKAYRGLNSENFNKFIGFFEETGRSTSTKNQFGQTLLSIISTHRMSSAYVEALKDAKTYQSESESAA